MQSTLRRNVACQSLRLSRLVGGVCDALIHWPNLQKYWKTFYFCNWMYLRGNIRRVNTKEDDIFQELIRSGHCQNGVNWLERRCWKEGLLTLVKVYFSNITFHFLQSCETDSARRIKLLSIKKKRVGSQSPKRVVRNLNRIPLRLYVTK